MRSVVSGAMPAVALSTMRCLAAAAPQLNPTINLSAVTRVTAASTCRHHHLRLSSPVSSVASSSSSSSSRASISSLPSTSASFTTGPASCRLSSSSSSNTISSSSTSPSSSSSLPLFDYSTALHFLLPSSSPSQQSLPGRVRLVEVGPRDGLQNERAVVSTADKVALVDGLSECGLSVIEVGSFVSPRWVPAMADSLDVFRAIRRRSGVSYAALTPNLQGLERALEADASEVAVFASASESFSRANINCSVDDSLLRFAPLMERARQSGVRVRGYVSCVVGW